MTDAPLRWRAADSLPYESCNLYREQDGSAVLVEHVCDENSHSFFRRTVADPLIAWGDARWAYPPTSEAMFRKAGSEPGDAL